MQFIYLILSLYFGRKNPLFFLIFPLALLQGPGAFIDTRTVLIAPELFLLGKNIFKDIIIFYMLAVVFYLNKKENFKLIWKTPMKWYFVLIIFLTIITIISYGASYEAIAIIRLFLYMPLGFYLLVLILSATSYKNFMKFFNVLFIVNIIQSILYVLNSSGIFSVFDQTLIYSQLEEVSTGFMRDFNTIPIFSNLLFVYAFVEILNDKSKISKKIIYATLATYPLVILYTFTRSMLFITIMEIVFVFGVYAIYSPRKMLKPQLLLIVIGGIVLFSVIQTVFVNEFGYFNERMSGLSQGGLQEENVDVRIRYHEKAWELLSKENSLLTGYALNKRLEPQMTNVGAWAADSTIPFLLLYTGIIGVLIYYWNQFYFLFLSMRNKFHQLDTLSVALFAVILSGIIASIIMGGQSWGNPLIFFNFSLLVYLHYSKPQLIKINAAKIP